MPTADREGLREALVDQIARVIDPDAHHLGRPDYYGPEPILAGSSARVRVARKVAGAIIAGPLSDFLAQADTAAQAVAERDEARAEMRSACLDALVAQDRANESYERFLAAQAEVARLSAEVEALRAERDEALSHLPEGLRGASLTGAVQALAFSARSDSDSKWRWGHALTIGLAFADKAAGEEWEHGGMASVDVCHAMAATLKCECGDDEWAEMAKAGAARLAEHQAFAHAADQSPTDDLAAGQDKTEGGHAE